MERTSLPSASTAIAVSSQLVSIPNVKNLPSFDIEQDYDSNTEIGTMELQLAEHATLTSIVIAPVSLSILFTIVLLPAAI